MAPCSEAQVDCASKLCESCTAASSQNSASKGSLIGQLRDVVVASAFVSRKNRKTSKRNQKFEKTVDENKTKWTLELLGVVCPECSFSLRSRFKSRFVWSHSDSEIFTTRERRFLLAWSANLVFSTDSEHVEIHWETWTHHSGAISSHLSQDCSVCDLTSIDVRQPFTKSSGDKVLFHKFLPSSFEKVSNKRIERNQRWLIKHATFNLNIELNEKYRHRYMIWSWCVGFAFQIRPPEA